MQMQLGTIKETSYEIKQVQKEGKTPRNVDAENPKKKGKNRGWN